MSEPTEQKNDDMKRFISVVYPDPRDVQRPFIDLRTMDPVEYFDFDDIHGSYHIPQPEVSIERNVTPGNEGVTIRFDHSKYLSKLERGTDTPPHPFISKHRE